jgi:hypothetical protein
MLGKGWERDYGLRKKAPIVQPTPQPLMSSFITRPINGTIAVDPNLNLDA